MTTPAIHATYALLPDGWADHVRITLADGLITSVTPGVKAEAHDERTHTLLPGMINLHSHAFQRGMAGLAEVRGPAADSFWSWRDVMYRFALTLSPDQMQAIAAMAYMEMLETGFTRVGEFHYLHHGPDGRPYADRAEMAGRIVAAAGATGLGLTLLPVFYAHATFGGAKPNEGQRRFINDLDGFADLVERCQRHVARLEGSGVGIAPHSLRAVTEEELQHVTRLLPQAPVHLHIAEQVKEVEDCIAWSGQRPVEWLLQRFPVDPRWCLIHATHLTPDETQRMAGSGAIAGLCPVTEANLGDGIFNAPDFVAVGGRYGVGTDSNGLIDGAGELRQLEYSQRLATRQRNVLARDGGSTGRALYQAAALGGAVALGVAAPALAVGARADFVSLASEASAFAGRMPDQFVDTWIFASRGAIDGVWTAGRKRVSNGFHHNRETIAARFKATLEQVAAM